MKITDFCQHNIKKLSYLPNSKKKKKKKEKKERNLCAGKHLNKFIVLTLKFTDFSKIVYMTATEKL